MSSETTMGGSGDEPGEVIPGLTPWSPVQSLREVAADELRFSRGFLRSRPEKWFPGLGAQWLPLAHSLGAEIRVLEVKPTLLAPPDMVLGYAGSLHDFPFGVLADEAGSQTLTTLFCPGGLASGRKAVLEYLARRFVASLAFSWSGGDPRQIFFRPDIDVASIPVVGSVRVTVEAHGRTFKVWLALCEELVGQLDGLWRRQLHSSTRGQAKRVTVAVEVAQLAVPPTVLSEYLRTGAVVDLEIPNSDTATLQLNGQPWLPARIVRSGKNLAVEVVPGPVSNPSLPPGTTRLSIEIASFQLDPDALAELGQVGAMWNTGVGLSDQVALSINSEKVGAAKLCSFQGRLAISVL